MPGWFSPVSSISTGLLFGVSLLHLIPDCTTDMQNALERIGYRLTYSLLLVVIYYTVHNAEHLPHYTVHIIWTI